MLDSKWVACTLPARVFVCLSALDLYPFLFYKSDRYEQRPLLCLTVEHPPHGLKSAQKTLSSRSSSLLVRAWLLRKSVLPSVTRTVFLKSVLSLETKSSVSSNPTVRLNYSWSPYTHTLTLRSSLFSTCNFLHRLLFYTYLLFGDRTWPIRPWGPLAPHQKGGCRSQASRSQSQG